MNCRACVLKEIQGFHQFLTYVIEIAYFYIELLHLSLLTELRKDSVTIFLLEDPPPISDCLPHIVLLFFISFHFLSAHRSWHLSGLCLSPLLFLSCGISEDFFPPAWLLRTLKSGPAALPSLLVPDLCGTSHLHVQKIIMSRREFIIK